MTQPTVHLFSDEVVFWTTEHARSRIVNGAVNTARAVSGRGSCTRQTGSITGLTGVVEYSTELAVRALHHTGGKQAIKEAAHIAGEAAVGAWPTAGFAR